MTFAGIDPDSFASKDRIVEYFEAYAEQIAAPIRCGVEVKALRKKADGSGFVVETSEGVIEAINVVAATGPFQRPIIPAVVPANAGILQIHSAAYRNPGQMPEGAVLVVGAGSSGAQIADELQRAGKPVYLSIARTKGARRYRGKDFVWWLGALGQWMSRPSNRHGACHYLSQWRLWRTYRGLPAPCRAWDNVGGPGGIVQGRGDALRARSGTQYRSGDANYFSVLYAADAYVAMNGLDLPEEPEACKLEPDPDCVPNPVLELNLAKAGVTSIVWATGYALDLAG